MYVNIGELSAEWQEFLAILEEQEGVLTTEQIEQMKKLEDNTEYLVKKLAGVITFNRVQVKACEAEILNMQTKALVYENKAQSLEKHLLSIFGSISNKQTRGGALQYSSATVTLTETNSESIVVTNKELVPNEYKIAKATSEVSKTLVKQALEAGINVPGIEVKKTKSLKIK